MDGEMIISSGRFCGPTRVLRAARPLPRIILSAGRPHPPSTRSPTFAHAHVYPGRAATASPHAPPDIRSPSSGDGHRARAHTPACALLSLATRLRQCLNNTPSAPAAVCRTRRRGAPTRTCSFLSAGGSHTPTPRKAHGGRVLGVRRGTTTRPWRHARATGGDGGTLSRRSCTRASSKSSVNTSAARVESWLLVSRARARSNRGLKIKSSGRSVGGAGVLRAHSAGRPSGLRVSEIGLRAYVAAKVGQRGRRTLALLGFSNALTAEPDVVCRALLDTRRDQ